MIIENASKTETTAENKYNIEVTAKTFRSLFGDLYSKPFESMIREIVANAHDANRRAGYTGPVGISAHKDGAEHYIQIKDNGIGMNHSDMVNVYTTFFKSTKDNNNEDIGGFGIGSKSPLAYADYFISTSVKDGKKNVIMTSKNNDMPSYQVMLKDADTNEPNGTTVRIPIRQEDIGKLEEVYQNQLIGFWPLPKLTKLDGKEFKFNVFEVTDGLRVTSVPGHYRSTLMISVGGPAYSMRNVATYFDCQTILDVPIGEVKVSLSRESITYDDDIRSLSLKIHKEKMAKVFDKIKKMTKEELLNNPWVFGIVLFPETRPILDEIFDKLGFDALDGLKWGFWNKPGMGKYCSKATRSLEPDVQKKELKGYVMDMIRLIMKEDCLNFAPTSMVKDSETIVPPSCMPKGLTLFIDKPEDELKAFAASLGKECNIVNMDSPKVRKYLSRTNKGQFSVGDGEPIRFSDTIFFASNGSEELVYDVDKIKPDELFVVGSPSTSQIHYSNAISALKKIFPGKDIYVGRGTPKGFEAAKICGLPNVLTFTAGEVSQLHIYKLMEFMSDEVKEEAVKYGKGFLRARLDSHTIRASCEFGGDSISFSEFVYSRSELLKNRAKEIGLEILNSGDAITTKEVLHPLNVVGIILIKQQIRKVLDERYPMWDDINLIFCQYIERLDNELQRNGQS